MDPIANIKEQLELANAVLNGDDGSSTVERLAELVIALDEWRKMGGFDPYGGGGSANVPVKGYAGTD